VRSVAQRCIYETWNRLATTWPQRIRVKKSSPKFLGDFADSFNRTDEEVETVLFGPFDEFDVILGADVQAGQDRRQVFGDSKVDPIVKTGSG